MNSRDKGIEYWKYYRELNNSQKIMTIATGVHTYFAVDNPTEVFLIPKQNGGTTTWMAVWRKASDSKSICVEPAFK